MMNKLWSKFKIPMTESTASKFKKKAKTAGLYGLGAVGLYFGAKMAYHASVLKTDDPRYKALRKSGFMDDKGHQRQLAYWKKRNA